MQDRDISSIEFLKILQEAEKYHKLKADIRNQAKTKVKQITKNSQKNYLNKKGKKARNILSKNRKYFRYPGCQWHLKYELPPPLSM